MFTKNNMTIVTHQPYFSLLDRVEDKTERPPFLNTEAIETESQAVLNSLKEQDFQYDLK
jgi:hypothetical protein